MNWKKTAFIIILLGTIAFGVWYFILRWTKTRALKIIIEAKEGRTESSYSGFDDDFLIAWAKSIKAKEPSFTHEGKTYSSYTAKQI